VNSSRLHSERIQVDAVEIIFGFLVIGASFCVGQTLGAKGFLVFLAGDF